MFPQQNSARQGYSDPINTFSGHQQTTQLWNCNNLYDPFDMYTD